jgi:hypothetical protein
MWARVARFDGDPETVDDRIARLQAMVDEGDLPADLAGARLMLLVDRGSGGMLGVTLFETEDAMRKGDAAMNQGAGRAGTRSAVEFYEVPINQAM